MAIVRLWERPPERRQIAAVDAGVVVTVRIWPTTSVLREDANGVPPHVTFVADMPDQGTSGWQMYDSVTGLYGPEIEGGSRPIEARDGSIDLGGGAGPEGVFFKVDVGRPFVVPWRGFLFLEGGAFPGAVAPYQFEVIRTCPDMQSIKHAGPGGSIRSRTRFFGQRDIESPTMTFLNVPAGGTPIAIPRGAHSVMTNAAATLVSHIGGSAPAGTITIPLPAGLRVPLGLASQGTFTASGAAIKILTFFVEIG
jgi:hypothetical protein